MVQAFSYFLYVKEPSSAVFRDLLARRVNGSQLAQKRPSHRNGKQDSSYSQTDTRRLARPAIHFVGEQ